MFFAITSFSRAELLQLPGTDAYLPAMLLALQHPQFHVGYERQGSGRSSGYSLRSRIDLAQRANRWITNFKKENRTP